VHSDHVAGGKYILIVSIDMGAACNTDLCWWWWGYWVLLVVGKAFSGQICGKSGPLSRTYRGN
jgi:hypothetical protein